MTTKPKYDWNKEPPPRRPNAAGVPIVAPPGYIEYELPELPASRQPASRLQDYYLVRRINPRGSRDGCVSRGRRIR